MSDTPPKPAQNSARRVLTSYPVRLLAAVVLVVVGAVVAARLGLVGEGSPANAPARASAPSQSQAAPTTAAAPGQIEPGVWLVGSDVTPGTYRSSGGVDGYCMWSRHSTAAGGPMDDIIASDGSRGGQMIVTIEPGDVVFRTNGCAPWERAG